MADLPVSNLRSASPGGQPALAKPKEETPNAGDPKPESAPAEKVGEQSPAAPPKAKQSAQAVVNNVKLIGEGEPAAPLQEVNEEGLKSPPGGLAKVEEDVEDVKEEQPSSPTPASTAAALNKLAVFQEAAAE
eukprot:gene21978-29039_t